MNGVHDTGGLDGLGPIVVEQDEPVFHADWERRVFGMFLPVFACGWISNLLFGLLLNSGLRISEALGLKVRDVRLRDGTALAVRVIGKGDKERLVPLPEKFGQVFGFWMKEKPAEEYVFAQKPRGQPPGAHAARAYLRRLKDKAHIAKVIKARRMLCVGEGYRHG
jgi:integrase